MSGRPEPEDWIKTTRTIPVTFSDHLMGGGVPEGSRGVVRSRVGNRVTVLLDTGSQVTIRASDVRVTKRIGGTEAFQKRSRTIGTIRLALALFLLAPIGWFVLQYLWAHKSFDGIMVAFVEAGFFSLNEWIATAIAHPGQTLIYSLFLYFLGRVALRN